MRPLHTKLPTLLATLLLVAAPTHAQPEEEPTPIVDPDPCDLLLCPTAPNANPWVITNLDFELKSCTGVKEKIKESSTTIGGGVAKAGPLWVAFLGIQFESTDLGWSWSYSCTMVVTKDVWAVGGGSFWREVVIFSRSPTSNTLAEASCFYDGIVDDHCRTPTIIRAGTEFVIKESSDGVSDGYPTEVGAESTATGRNQPAGGYEFCATNHACTTLPSPGDVDARAPTHKPVVYRMATISWSDPKINVPELLNVPTVSLSLPGMVTIAEPSIAAP